jgi:hypothetical protein
MYLPDYEEFLEDIKKIRTYWASRYGMNDKNPAMGIFLLKNMGYTDQPVDTSNDKPHLTFEQMKELILLEAQVKGITISMPSPKQLDAEFAEFKDVTNYESS